MRETPSILTPSQVGQYIKGFMDRDRVLSGLLGKLGLGKLDSGDILLLLILFLLWREGDHFDLVLLLALAFLFLRDSDT